MSTQTMTTGARAEPANGTTLFAMFADWRAARARKAAQRALCARLEAMDDRMLLDIGMNETEIARLRTGDRFVPTLVQMVSNGVGFSA